MDATPPWNIGILTVMDAGENEYREIKNCLLYGEHSYWIPLEVAASSVKPLSYTRFRESLKSGDAEQVITVYANPYELFDFGAAFRLSNDGHGPLEIPPVGEPVAVPFSKSIRVTFRDCRVFVSNVDTSGAPDQNWNSYNAAHALMMGMSRLLLPDVSDLPIGGIMDLREKMKDSLDPMRAEMLRLTDDLRKLVGTSHDPNLLTAEVDNLIATRVEPVVRDADRRAKEFLQKKWRKLFAGAAKAFGFAGAGFLDPKLLAKAVQQTLETGAMALSPVEDRGVSMSETAQFVLRARRLAVDLRDKRNG
jgi:hypothetical protein